MTTSPHIFFPLISMANLFSSRVVFGKWYMKPIMVSTISSSAFWSKERTAWISSLQNLCLISIGYIVSTPTNIELTNSKGSQGGHSL